MRDRLLELIHKEDLIPAGSRVLVGFSGGADSTCLLHLLKTEGYDIVAAHLNHSQRVEADEHEAQCRAFAEQNRIPFAAGKADVRRLAHDLKIGLEEAGRRARYAFFEETARQAECDLIATAHTQTDHVETILLNLTRGAGLAGLAGIPVRRGNIVRPLLFASREETDAYCREHGLPTLHDPTNDEDRFARVKVRQSVVPLLRGINPGFDRSAARMASIVDEEDRFLDGAAAAALERGEILLNGDLRFLTLDAEAAFDRPYLHHLPPVLLKRAIRLVVEMLGGAMDYDLTEQAARLINQVQKGSLTAEGGEVIVSWSDDRVHFYKSLTEEALKQPISLPGDTFHDGHGWKLSARVEAARPGAPSRASLEVQIDPDAFRGPLHVRYALPGDAMRPIGGTGHRKLSDLLSEAGLTLLARRRLPILCDIIGPLWAPGVTLDERARLASGSSSALGLEFGPILPKAPRSETEASSRTYANS